MNDAPLTQQIGQLLQAIEPVLAPVRQSGWQWRVVGGAVRIGCCMGGLALARIDY